MALNIFGKGTWATKITSLLVEGEYTQYDSTDYMNAPTQEWLVALQEGSDRESAINNYLSVETFSTLFKGSDDLIGVTYGSGLVVGPGTLIRPGTTIGDQVYIGANCVIDINCTIGKNVTINDGVIINEGSIIEDNTNVPPGSVVS